MKELTSLDLQGKGLTKIVSSLLSSPLFSLDIISTPRMFSHIFLCLSSSKVMDLRAALRS